VSRLELAVPIKVLEVELSGGIPAISASGGAGGQPYRQALSLVRLHGQPLGLVEIPLAGHDLSANEHAQEIWRELCGRINAHLRQDGSGAIETLTPRGVPATETPRCVVGRQAFLREAPFASVIISTRDRPELLDRCLRTILAVEYPAFEVIVVDNAPATDATCELIRGRYGGDPRVRYAREEVPGLSNARNRGTAEARAEIVAFADDDLLVDRLWLVELVRGFSVAERVGCVTGLIIPAELETAAQLWLEQYGGFIKGFRTRVFDLSTHRPPDPLFPFTIAQAGTGGSMAFTKGALRAIGGFDRALGTGTPARGGEDLAALFETVVAGYRIVYQPDAIVLHAHRRDYSGLHRQMQSYGPGLTAFATRSFLEHPLMLVRDFLPKLPRVVSFALDPASGKNAKKLADYPRELTRAELKGMVYGPVAYLRARFQVYRRARSARVRRDATTA